MTNRTEQSTVLIGGISDGQPINCTLPPIRTLVMLVGDGDEREGYTLRAFFRGGEERLFYMLDGMPADQAEALMRERWAQGLIHTDS